MSKVLELRKEDADQLYKTGNDAEKRLLEKLYPSVYSRDITDRIQTLDDAYTICGLQRQFVINASDTPDEAAYKDAKIIAKAYNEGWVKKKGDACFYPRMMENAGSGFSCDGCVCDYSSSAVGSRLWFKHPRLVIDAASKFPEVYNNLWC